MTSTDDKDLLMKEAHFNASKLSLLMTYSEYIDYELRHLAAQKVPTYAKTRLTKSIEKKKLMSKKLAFLITHHSTIMGYEKGLIEKNNVGVWHADKVVDTYTEVKKVKGFYSKSPSGKGEVLDIEGTINGIPIFIDVKYGKDTVKPEQAKKIQRELANGNVAGTVKTWSEWLQKYNWVFDKAKAKEFLIERANRL